MPNKLRKIALPALVSVGLTLLMIECGSAAMIYSGRIPAAVPSFELPKAEPPFWVDSDPHFGPWHAPNRTVEHKRACFSTSYRSNSYGALDIERPRSAQGPRAVVLGDSFTVGHGVVEDKRFSNRLEQLTGIPFMNFGAGGTSVVQYFLVYKHLASQFAHDRVLVGVLPDNDFDEGPHETRYRPYWKGEYPNYTLQYSLPRIEDSVRHPSRAESSLTAHDVLGAFSFFYNAADYVAGYRKVIERREDRPNYAGYFDFDAQQLARMRYSLEQIYALAPEHRMAVMAMPRLIDITRYNQEKKNPFGDAMTKIASEVGFQFVDMLPLMAKAYAGRERDLYLGCDGHWGPEGHDFAAKVLKERLYR